MSQPTKSVLSPPRCRLRATGVRWALCAVLAVAGCTQSTPPKQQLSVYAASSLSELFQDFERQFEQKRPGVDLVLTLSGSQIARLQLEHGAPGDVFASANEEHLRALERATLAAPSKAFAHGELVVIVPAENPANIDTFDDLPNATHLVVGAPNVPVGIYTRELLSRAGEQLGKAFAERVRSSIASEESNVRLARAKVELGQADAAIVYATDATPSTGIRVIEIPASLNVRSSYYIAPMQTSAQRQLADEFVSFVLSAEGQAVVERHGFFRSDP